MSNNVVEVVVSARDEASSGLHQLSESFQGLGETVLHVAEAFAVFEGIKKIFEQVAEEQTIVAQLDAGFKAMSDTVGVSRKALDEYAESIAKTTTYSRDLVQQGESVLLTFDRVRGEAFERTLKAATDLSARFGTDLIGNIRLLGFALQDPETGMLRLRRAGIALTDSQKDLIKSLADTGQVTAAQSALLDILEQKTQGSAAAARDTLGGALTALKNTFTELFDGTKESTQGTINAIEQLNKAINAEGFKTAINLLITGFAKVAEAITTVVTGLTGLFTKPLQTETEKIESQIKHLEDVLAPRRVGRTTITGNPDDIVIGGRGGRTGAGITRAQAQEMLEDLRDKLKEASKETPAEIPVEPIFDATKAKETALKAQKEFFEAFKVKLESLSIADLPEDPLKDLYETWNEDTRTGLEKVYQQIDSFFQKLQRLKELGLITPEQAAAREQDFDKNILPEVKVTSKTKLIADVNSLASEINKIWEGVGKSIQSNLSDAFYNASFSLKDFVNIFRRALADIASAIVTSNIKKLLADQLSGSGSSSSSGFGSILSAIVAGFANSAGGGRTDGPTIVGEAGPELVIPNGSGIQTFNQRQLAFAGGGGSQSVNFNPVYAPVFNGVQNEESMRREFQQFVLQKTESDKRELYRTLGRNGVVLR